MKILEINKFNFPKGGADKHFLDVCKLLESEGHEVARFCMDHENNFPTAWSKYFVSTVGYTEEYSLWQKIVGTCRMFYSFEARWKINKLLNDFNPDVVHLHNIYHQISPSILGQIKKRNIPIAATVHDYEWISPDREKFHPEVGKCYWKFVFNKNFGFVKKAILIAKKYFHQICGFEKMIDLYVSPSKYVKSILLDAGIEKNKIIVLKHFIPDLELAKNIDTIDTQVEKYVFYFGRISREKGVHLLIDIFKKDGKPNLNLAGKKEGGFVVEQHQKINNLGFLQEKEIKKMIRGSQYVVCASSLDETFGLIALETISEGKPFIALKTGAYAEIIENGKNGFLCESIEEMEKVIDAIEANEIVFDSVSIRKDAFLRFGRQQYCKKFIPLLLKSKI